MEPEVITDPNLSITDMDAWGEFAYIKGEVQNIIEGDAEFQIRKSGTQEWIQIPAVLDAKTYSAKTGKLDFGSTYDCRLVIGDKYSISKTFTTETYVAIPNLNFDSWTQNGKNWYANSDADRKSVV